MRIWVVEAKSEDDSEWMPQYDFDVHRKCALALANSFRKDNQHLRKNEVRIKQYERLVKK